MDPVIIAALTSPEGQAAMVLAAGQAEPSSLSAATAMRAAFPAELAAAALTQVELRRRATTKFGAAADSLFFTRDGLEQATRPEVAAHHADRFTAAGVRTVLDLGCGVGSDALAFLAAGLEVVAIEIDPATAEVARLNLAGRARVHVGDAEAMLSRLGQQGWGVYCDPARRTTSGRVWRVEDFTPSWTFVQRLLSGDRVAGVKLGPALPHSLIPASAEAEWVSTAGETVEVGLWSGSTSVAGSKVAMVLPGHRLVAWPDAPKLETAAPAAFVYEPDGAVIRAGGLTRLAELIGGSLLDPHIAYLTSDRLVRTPYATAFQVLEILPYQEKTLRRWLGDHRVGVVEIKKRGIEVDPAALRKRLRLAGPEQATLILTRSPQAALAIVARRVQ